MRVAIRVDASLQIGTGHAMRCVSLAAMLRARGADVFFACRQQAGDLCDFIEAEGFGVARLAADHRAPATRDAASDAASLEWRGDSEQTLGAIRSRFGSVDLLIVDHYELDGRWERLLRSVARRILVIDDLANREHDCDVLLDQGLYDSPGERYKSLVGPRTRTFIGPQYALLRGEFDAVRTRWRDGELKRILVFFGGVDLSNEALHVVDALRQLGERAPFATVVLGPVNPNSAEVQAAASGLERIEILGATRAMADLMTAADLGIGTCGGAAWERCAVGLPSLVVVSAENQRHDARMLEAAGAARNLGDAGSVTAAQWVAELARLGHSRSELAAMATSAALVMNGRHEAIRRLQDCLVG